MTAVSNWNRKYGAPSSCEAKSVGGMSGLQLWVVIEPSPESGDVAFTKKILIKLRRMPLLFPCFNRCNYCSPLLSLVPLIAPPSTTRCDESVPSVQRKTMRRASFPFREVFVAVSAGVPLRHPAPRYLRRLSHQVSDALYAKCRVF